MLLVLAILLICTPKEQYRRIFQETRVFVAESTAPYRRFLVAIGSLCIGAFVMGRMADYAGNFWDWPAATDFAGKAKLLSLLLIFVLGAALFKAMEGHVFRQQQRAVEAFLEPKSIMKFDIHGPNFGPIAMGGKGSSIAQHQLMQGNTVIEVNRDTIYSYADAVANEASLDPAARAKAVDDLNMIADQWERPAERRELFKVRTALEGVTGFVSSVVTLANGLNQLAPFIKAHFGIG